MSGVGFRHIFFFHFWLDNGTGPVLRLNFEFRDLDGKKTVLDPFKKYIAGINQRPSCFDYKSLRTF